MPVYPPVCDFGWTAPGFVLPATDGKIWSLSDVAGPRGTLVMFICNHCPYVLAVLDRILRDARDLQALGIGVAAISSNDAASYPEDSFPNMQRMAPSGPSRSPICTTKARRSRAPGARPAPPISSASMPGAGCSIAGGWMPRASRPGPPMPGASFMKPCDRSPKPGAARNSRWPRWDVRSNGRPHERRNRIRPGRHAD